MNDAHAATHHDGHGHGHAHAHAHAHTDGHGAGYPVATLRDYLTGFGLSVVLTAIPFWLVMSGVIENKTVTAILILLMAAVQIVVHMIYFLHMNAKAEGGWTLMSLIFTVMVLAIALSGSVWIMYHLKVNMMPPTMSQMP
jgi:cytochrome o ubiquinol oxidase operon protein cyoD